MNRLCNSLKLCLIAGLACLAVLSLARTTENDALQQQTLTVIKCIKTKDWKALFATLAVTGDLKKINADDFAKGFAGGMEKSGHAKDFDTFVNAIQSYSVGAPVIEQNRGYVPTSLILKLNDHEFNFVGIARMIKDDGVWKLDFTTEGGDMEKLSELRFGQLVGGIAVPGNP